MKNETVDFLLPFFRIKGRGLSFDQFKFFCEGAPSQYKNLIEPLRNRAGYIVQWCDYIEDAFILDKGRPTIKKFYFDPTKGLSLLQESYFIYDHSFLVKPSFTSKLSISFYQSIAQWITILRKKKKKRKEKKIQKNQQIKKDFLSKNWWKKDW